MCLYIKQWTGDA